MLELTVLGAGPAYSDQPGSLGSAYLVRAGADAIVLDLGQGAFPALAHAIEPSSLHGVLISHLHPDHFIDLIPLRHYLCRAEFQPGRRVRVLAPVGLERRLDAVYDQPGFAAAAFDLEALTPGSVRAGSFTIEVATVHHAGESFAFRVAGADATGAGIVYSGDCADPSDLLPLIRPGDTLLAEATFGPGPLPAGMPHLDGPMVGRLATAGGVVAVLLTHLRMGCDPEATVRSATKEYDGPVTLVRPGDRFTV
ncbi:MAG TPA: MBL fold metallo-hydrolase [Candidatus Limnocylindrales bacterium]|jgi:ribonuclease BN (tRNA processing enzyme)|nr:MBL fold metallo-hydrolase [Candidatus Limnocylindrales bacterium]